MNKDIALVEKSVSKQEAQATALVITDDAGMEKAVALLSQTNLIADNVKEEKEKITKPLNEALSAERARWKPIETACANAIATIRGKMMLYQKAVDAAIKEKEAKLMARVEKGTMKVDTAVRKMDELPDSVQTISTSFGQLQWTTVKKLVIDDASLIPREYLDVNETRVREALKAGTVVPGAKLVEEKVPKNLR
jgi:CRISPR/Cas system CMR subunit Cmr4 (Cas7 group RAMP superfamily)